MSKSELAEKLLTATLLGAMLGLSKRTIARLNSSGKIPAPVHIGKSVRWAESDILKWIQAGTPERKRWGIMKEGAK